MDTRCRIRARIDILIWLTLIYSYMPHRTFATEVPDEVVTTVRGESVALTCPIDVTSCGALHSVKWFKGNDRVAVVSGDGAVKTVEGPFTGRMSILHNPKGPASTLSISSVQVFDEDNYVCETTFLEPMENCENTGSFIIGLLVYVHPASIKMLDQSSLPISNATTLGPFYEGFQWSSTCEVRGTRPSPQIGWYRAGKRLTDSITLDEADGLFTVKSSLSLSLSRQELGIFIECRVESAALADTIRNQIYFDMHVLPTQVQLSGIKPQIGQGIIVQAVCLATGARPAVNITWYNNTHAIEPSDSSERQSIRTKTDTKNDGTFTTLSKLVFTTTPFEDGVTIWCEANTVVPTNNISKPLKDTFTMEVLYLPIVQIKQSNITVNETGEFQLDCEYMANPKQLKSVKWLRNGVAIDLNQGRVHSVKHDKTSVLVKDANRNDIGVYNCELENVEGVGTSAGAISIDVHFVPVVGLSMDPNNTIIENNESNVTLFCNVLSGNPSTLLMVRWFLDGQILKELPECAENELEEDEPLCGVNPNILLLENVGREFLGNYSCEGMNMAGWGRRSKESELIVYFEPGNATLTHTPTVATKKKNVTFSCTVDDLGYPKASKYRWLRGGSPVMDVVSSVWTVDPVGLDSRTSFSCYAFNEGGKGQLATVQLDVRAPQTFIQKLHPYTGALFSAPAISLTCRVECVPICEITWFKNGVGIEMSNDHYNIKNTYLPAEPAVGDFESVRSVLHFNMSAWPDKKFDIMRDNANYSCASSSSADGPGVRSATYFGVEYPPNNISISTTVVNVELGSHPPRVSCSAKAYPEPSYEWRRQNEVIAKGNILYIFRNLTISDNGGYECVAFNKHGQQSVSLHMNVLFKPNCTLMRKEVVNEDMLVCNAVGNPSEINFEWTMRSENQSMELPEVRKSQVGNMSTSFILLDEDSIAQRVYRCMTNNTLGPGQFCEIEVTVWPKRHILWWQRLDKLSLYVMLGVIISLLLAVIIVCIIILCICRKRRRQNKYHTDLTISPTQSGVIFPMQQKPMPKFASSSDVVTPTTGSTTIPEIPKSPPKWPLRPGVMVHVKVDTKQNLCAARAQSPISTKLNRSDITPNVTVKDADSSMQSTTKPKSTVSLMDRKPEESQILSNQRNIECIKPKLPTPPRHFRDDLQPEQLNFHKNPFQKIMHNVKFGSNENRTSDTKMTENSTVQCSKESISSHSKIDAKNIVKSTRSRKLDFGHIFSRLPKRNQSIVKTVTKAPSKKASIQFLRRSVSLFGSAKSTSSGTALFYDNERTPPVKASRSHHDVFRIKPASLDSIQPSSLSIVVDDNEMCIFDPTTKPNTTSAKDSFHSTSLNASSCNVLDFSLINQHSVAANIDKSSAVGNPMMEHGEYNILSNIDSDAKTKKLTSHATDKSHDFPELSQVQNTSTSYSYNLANSFPPCYSSYRSLLNDIDNGMIPPTNCKKLQTLNTQCLAENNGEKLAPEFNEKSATVLNTSLSLKKSTKHKSEHKHRLKSSLNIVDSESPPKFHSLRKNNKPCKHHQSNGNLPADQILPTTMPYISQHFHTIDSHHQQPYYENITDSIEIHEASLSMNGANNSSIINHTDEFHHVVNNDYDHLHRNSLYRSDSGISNSSYDCTTPVPAPRPNSRKCQSVPVYMNLPGKSTRSNMSLLNEVDQSCQATQCLNETPRQLKPSQKRGSYAETSMNRKYNSNGKKVRRPIGLQDVTSQQCIAITPPSSAASNQIKLPLLPSIRRPVKLPLRKHHTFHFQSSQTIAGAANRNDQHQMAPSNRATRRKQYRNEGPLLFKPFNENSAFKPITPMPMSPSQPLSKILSDDVSLMSKNQQYFEDHNGSNGHYSTVSRQGNGNLRRHTSNVEDFSGRSTRDSDELTTWPTKSSNNVNPMLQYANLDHHQGQQEKPISKNNEAFKTTGHNNSCIINRKLSTTQCGPFKKPISTNDYAAKNAHPDPLDGATQYAILQFNDSIK